jgi:hypothetical protein
MSTDEDTTKFGDTLLKGAYARLNKVQDGNGR